MITDSDIVYVGVGDNDGTVLTDTLKVAEFFGKKHKSVLRAVRCMMDSNSAQFCAELKVIKSSYVCSNGQTQPMYLLNRDAFTMLAFSFTGEKAMEFKSRYISAFNKMESELKKRIEVKNEVVLPSSPLEVLQIAINQMVKQEEDIKRLQLENDRVNMRIDAIEKEREETTNTLKRITDEERGSEASLRNKINILVVDVVKKTGLTYNKVYHLLYDRFRLVHHVDLKARYENARNAGASCESVIEYAEKEGYIGSLYKCLVGLISARKWDI